MMETPTYFTGDLMVQWVIDSIFLGLLLVTVLLMLHFVVQGSTKKGD